MCLSALCALRDVGAVLKDVADKAGTAGRGNCFIVVALTKGLTLARYLREQPPCVCSGSFYYVCVGVRVRVRVCVRR